MILVAVAVVVAVAAPAPGAVVATAPAPILATAPAPATPPVVAIDSGRIAGEHGGDGRLSFRGVPFAAAPVGARRWRAPAPVRPWRGVRTTTVSAPSCAQLDDGWNKANAAFSAEDCLYLDLATPTLAPARPMPVLVWIHGGSNKAGGGAGTIASSIVRRGIVLVSIQYRLGPLGFMAHPALTGESTTRSSGNYGLMDQQAALRWVRRNIARFGGDPANVTIAGGSAGAQDVGLQQLSPLAAGLFDKAIESGGTAGFGFAPRDLTTSEAIGDEIATLAGAPHASAATLRALPAAPLLAAARRIATPAGLPEPGTVWLQATIDGHVITETPAKTLARGAGQRVPLLIGSNTREIDFYATPAAARQAIDREFGADAATVTAHYGLNRTPPPADDPVFGPVALRVATDIVFTCPAAFVARTRRQAGVPVWRYSYGYPVKDAPVTHGAELGAIFGNPGEGGNAADAPPLQAYWANFARNGDPNGPGLPRWPVYAVATGAYLAIDPAGPVAATGFGDPVCPLRAVP